MDFETEEPAHEAFSSLRDSLEGLVNVYPLIADRGIPQKATVYISDPCALAQNDLLHEYDKRNSHIMPKFHKVVVLHYLRKQPADMLQVKMFQTMVPRVMEDNHDAHHPAFDSVDSL